MTDDERHLTNSLISLLSRKDEIPTRSEVEEKARGLAALEGYTGDLANIVTEALEARVTVMGAGVSIVDVEANHDDRWVEKRTDITWTYSNAYDEFLRNEGWSLQVKQSLSDVTLRILGHLQDPLSDGTTWSRRGLVIGHVQSGKTANYTGLIARAADAGYKFIVVIAGIHNNLRKQTQQRIDEAFIGRSSEPNDRRNIGVGLNRNYPHPATLTNVNDDFNKKTAAKSGWKINDFRKPVILIIKKNVTTLKELYKWAKAMNASAGGQISDVPMLLIDDEADNASINTNKPELDPTRTNALIRQILSLFGKSCYVGYTATPFANIFINPDSYDDGVREELFPRDFIYCLDAPSNYFGAERVFLDEEESRKILREIDDCEGLIPHGHKQDILISTLPESLLRALDEFIVARAIRNVRGQRGKHCSMMVNVSRYVKVQRVVCNLLSAREKEIREAVRANARMPEEISSRSECMQRLKQVFDQEYGHGKESWEKVKAALIGVFDNLHLYVVNSKSDQALDYARYGKDGVGLTAIAVGGLSLSRGLTIEGLTVSYMYRNTKMYDTLMQMGRWFGYRPGYDDLCRVHLPKESINWYAHIADATEELVQQVKHMRRDGRSPREFGLYVRSHPDTLLITAQNKMRSAQTVVFHQSYSGRLVESYIVSVDRGLNDRNIELIKRFWKDGFGGKQAVDTGKGVMFRDVSIGQIESFLEAFDCHTDFLEQKKGLLKYLEQIDSERPMGDVLLISPEGGGGGSSPFSLRTQQRVVKEGKLNGTAWRLSKNRVSSRGDERLGLSPEQIKEAEEFVRDQNSKDKISDAHYRRVRNKPLLMIHSIEPKGGEVPGPVAAFGMSFPYGDHEKTVEVVANRVWFEQQMRGDFEDDPDGEDDYDE